MMFIVQCLASVAFTLLAVVLAPVLPLFAVRRATYYSSSVVCMPQWLTWFDTFEEGLDAGVMHGYFDPKWGTYINRVRWLLRNPAYGFHFWALGAWLDEPASSFRTDTPTGWQQWDTSGDVSGTHGVWRGIRFKLGHKVFQWQNPMWRVNGRQRTMFTFSISLAK